MKKLLLGLALTSVFFTTPALANNQAKIDIITQMIYSGWMSDQAITNDLSDLIYKMEEMDEYVRMHYDELGCEVHKDTYLGHNYGEATYIQNVKVTVVNNNLVRATFQTGIHPNKMSNAVLLEFAMQGNKVNDIRVGNSNNPNKIPTTTTDSLQNHFRKHIQMHCGFKTR